MLHKSVGHVRLRLSNGRAVGSTVLPRKALMANVCMLQTSLGQPKGGDLAVRVLLLQCLPLMPQTIECILYGLCVNASGACRLCRRLQRNWSSEFTLIMGVQVAWTEPTGFHCLMLMQHSSHQGGRPGSRARPLTILLLQRRRLGIAWHSQHSQVCKFQPV